MLKEKVGSIKNALVKVEKNDSKKSIENLIMIVIVLVITLIAINYILKDDKNKKNSINTNTINNNANLNECSTADGSGITNYNSLEERLSEILSHINGVGEVRVLLTYSESNKINPVYNEDRQTSTTEETDTEGGKRTISSINNKKEVVYSNNNIITESVSSPQIQGAVIIARGADNTKVKSDIIQAVAAATGLSTYKIQVFEMN
ncbi:MAG: hypothetical protein IKE91_06900 [Clostridia bacterium]|nr:hypothetical protein [Clostridia bacterium]